MSLLNEQDHYWMQQAIQLAQSGADNHEVPVGAVLIQDNKLIGQGANCPIATCDPTAHAEMIALRDGGRFLQNYRLIETTLYVTLEPCVMCIGAIIHARVKRVVFGAYDPKAGAVESAFCLGHGEQFNHRVEWKGGVESEACGAILKDFFQVRRLVKLKAK